MICSHCGKLNTSNSLVCLYCGSKLEIKYNTDEYLENFNQDEGFSRPDSKYTKPEVMIPSENQQTIDTAYFENLDERTDDYLYSEEQGKNKVNDNKTDDNNEKEEQKSNKILFSKKRIVLTIGCIATLFIIITSINILYNNLSSSKTAFVSKNAIEVFSNDETNDTFIINTDGFVLYRINEYLLPVWYKKDYSGAILYDKEINNFYYVDSKKHTLIAENQFVLNSISDEGKMLYCTSDQKGVSQLKLFDPKKDNNDVIEAEKGMYYSNSCISPDGKSYAFTRLKDINDLSSCESFTSINGGKLKSFGKKTVIYLISDDGKYIYYNKILSNDKLEFCVSVDGEEQFISANVWPISINHDKTEIMMQDNNSNYVLINGKEKIAMNENIQIRNIIASGMKQGDIINSGLFLNIDTLKNKVVVNQSNLLSYIDNNYQAITLASLPNIYKANVSLDGNMVLYRSILGNLNRIINLTGQRREEVIAENIEDYETTDDFSEIYYLKGQKQIYNSYSFDHIISDLYYKKGEDGPVLVETNVSDIQMNKAGDTLFFIKVNLDGSRSLQYSRNGSKAVLIDGYTDADSLEEWNCGIVLKEKKDGKYILYYNSDDILFKLILGGLSISNQTVNY